MHISYKKRMAGHMEDRKNMYPQGNNKADFESRLKAVAYMRQSEAESRLRLEHAKQILQKKPMESNGYFYPNSNPATEYTALEPEQNETGSKIGISLMLRSCLVLLILGCFYVGKSAPNGKIKALLEDTKTQITVDYSDNLFDFIEKIPYTLSYEKINAKGRDPIKN